MFALAAVLLAAPPVPPPAATVPATGSVPAQFGGGGGFGGGGFGGGGFGTFDTVEPTWPTGETWIQGQAVGVLISPDGSRVWGYSAAAGGLTPLPVEVPEAERGAVAPVVGPGVAMLIVDGTVYAYGGASGEWGVQPVGDRAGATPVVAVSIAAVRVEGGVYAYSGTTGTGGLHPLGEGEEAIQPTVGPGIVTVRSARGFGVFSGAAGTWGSVRYPAADGDPAESGEGAAPSN